MPIEPDFPEERIGYILADTSASIVLTSKKSNSISTAVEIIELDTDWESINTFPIVNPQTIAQPHHLAYVIYISGSTGKPKGVMIEQTAL